MPYFQRKPYAEMLKGAMPDIGADAYPPAPAEPPFLDRAASILQEESGQLPKHASAAQSVPNFAGLPACIPASLPSGVTMLQPKSPVKAGQTANLTISVANDSTSAATCTASATDLISAGGGRIGTRQIRFSPRDLTIPANASADVQIAIDIPVGTVPGQYVGMVLIGGPEAVHAVLTVSVTP